jgi:hypothetical protein
MTTLETTSLRPPSALLMALTLGSLTIALAGCGNDSSKTTPKTQTAGTQAGTPLAHPLLARCGTVGFAKPRTAPFGPQKGSPPRGWQVGYQVPLVPGHLPKGGVAAITLVEQPPNRPGGQTKGGNDKTIGGHTVNLRVPPHGIGPFIARWKTSRARYVLLASHMTQARLETFIACMP